MEFIAGSDFLRSEAPEHDSTLFCDLLHRRQEEEAVLLVGIGHQPHRLEEEGVVWLKNLLDQLRSHIPPKFCNRMAHLATLRLA
jgi:hypothetical protein